MTGRPRAAILAFAAVVLAVVLAFTLWPAASPRPAPSNQSRETRKPAAGPTDPDQLKVRLEGLKQPAPEPAGDYRNPFRFYVKPPPPPPPPSERRGTASPSQTPAQPAGPPPLPPIPLKFIGTMEQGSKKVAIFSDGRGMPLYAPEGGLVLGQYRVVRIGVESVVMEYADGRGRQTIPMRGQ